MREEYRGVVGKIHDSGTDVIDRIVSGDLKGLIGAVAIQVGPFSEIDTAPARNYAAFNSIRQKLEPQGVFCHAWYTAHGDVARDAADIKGIIANGWSVWLNAEDGYARENFARTSELYGRLSPFEQSRITGWSYPTTPADRYAQDYRYPDTRGAVFCPQSYYCQFPEESSKVKPLFWSTYAPNVIWQGWWYRVNFRWALPATQLGIRWCRIDGIAWRGNTAYFKVVDGGYSFWVEVEQTNSSASGWRVGTGEKRNVYKISSTDDSLVRVGNFLGFTAQGNINPTIGTYNGYEGDNPTNNTELVNQLKALKAVYPGLEGFGVYVLENTRASLVKQLRSVIYG